MLVMRKAAAALAVLGFLGWVTRRQSTRIDAVSRSQVAQEVAKQLTPLLADMSDAGRKLSTRYFLAGILLGIVGNALVAYIADLVPKGDLLETLLILMMVLLVAFAWHVILGRHPILAITHGVVMSTWGLALALLVLTPFQSPRPIQLNFVVGALYWWAIGISILVIGRLVWRTLPLGKEANGPSE